jgi:large subunit ribosomal protein L32
MRHTSSHTKNRRSHHALKNRVIVKDKESGALRLPHRLDETTGMYRGKLIGKPKAEKATKEKEEKPVKAKKEKKEKAEKVEEVKEETAA